MQCVIKSFKKTIADNLYDFIVIDCNNNSLRSLNEFYCHSKDSGYVVSLIVTPKYCYEHFFLFVLSLNKNPSCISITFVNF